VPVVRIDLVEGQSEEYREKVGEIVYQTLVDILSVPKHDRFQVITEHRKKWVVLRSGLPRRPSIGRLHLLADHIEQRPLY
jgi:hypothetical protein